MSWSADASLAETKWANKPRLAALQRLGITTLADLLRHYPRRHEDRRRFDFFPEAECAHSLCLCGKVVKTVIKRFGRRQKIFELTLEDEGGVFSRSLVCRWFNLHYVQKMFAVEQRVVVYGRPKMKGKVLVMDHPEFEVIETDEEISLHLNRIVPVHPAGEGVSVRVVRGLVHRALEEIDWTTWPCLVPGNYARALRDIHFPVELADATTARELLALDEFFRMQLVMRSRRAASLQTPGKRKPISRRLVPEFIRNLPFSLTEGQGEVLHEIASDLASARRMSRLLQGDVGSGKTVVALAAMLQVVEAGFQAAMMAPTQILAEQHFATASHWLAPLGVRVALLTGQHRKGFTDSLTEPHVVIGTHALLHQPEMLADLGLVVIDEQHKFGVLQRARLVARPEAPDVLVMTATPIPRTLTQTFYSDLDVSVLTERPALRGKILTAIRTPEKLPEIIRFFESELRAGRQAYIVYPLIEGSDKLEVKAAAAEFERWAGVFPDFRVGLLHGRVKAPQKEAVMQDFQRGVIQVLVATSVIEVGVDVPNATLMLIENPERFGLAQLHQLRGRIGRGAHKSYCVLLVASELDPSSHKKLEALEATIDGFRIAEADLEVRGPGDVLGTAQTGLPALRLGNLLQDGKLIDEARILVDAILAQDPKLLAPAHALYRKIVDEAESSLIALEG